MVSFFSCCNTVFITSRLCACQVLRFTQSLLHEEANRGSWFQAAVETSRKHSSSLLDCHPNQRGSIFQRSLAAVAERRVPTSRASPRAVCLKACWSVLKAYSRLSLRSAQAVCCLFLLFSKKQLCTSLVLRAESLTPCHVGAFDGAILREDDLSEPLKKRGFDWSLFKPLSRTSSVILHPYSWNVQLLENKPKCFDNVVCCGSFWKIDSQRKLWYYRLGK